METNMLIKKIKKMEISSEDIKKIERFNEIMQKGYWASGQEVTELYNKVLGKNLTPTQCSSCIRHRISELVRALDNYKKQLEVEKPTETVEEPIEEPIEEKPTEEPIIEEKKEENNNATTHKRSNVSKKRTGRSKKATANG